MGTTVRRDESAEDGTRARLLSAIPLTEATRQLAGVSTAVLEGGAGPPMVLLHGHGEFAAVWLRVIPELVQTHRVIVPDLPGHGASQVTGDALSLDRVLSWLDELITETCSEPPILVGHLLGGAVAARYVTAHADRVAHLVLVDTMGLAWFRPAPSFALPMISFVARPTAPRRDRLFNRCFLDMDRVGEQTGASWPWLLEYALDRARTPSTQAALRQLMPKVGVPPIPADDLARIDVPTTLIHGRHDLQVRLKTAQNASVRFGWPLHIIDDARDDPAVEQPDAFLAALYSVVGDHAQDGRES